jgi:hypothetical protein
MRWKAKVHKIGDTRTITRFLFLPRQIGGEVRWLEFVQIRQVVRECAHEILPPPFSAWRWVDESFSDEWMA